MIKILIDKLYNSKTVAGLIGTHWVYLAKELSPGDTVLDIGCGPSSPVSRFDDLGKTVGIEAFEPYALRAKEAKTHDEIICANIFDVKLEQDSFDVVTMFEVIEHLPKDEGEELIDKLKKICRKKLIISTPNGFVQQKAIDGNELQAHLSGWEVEDFERRSFSRILGLAGHKALRQEVESETMDGDLLNSIKWKPRIFWFCISCISQLFLKHCPKSAFSLFCVYSK